MRLRMIAVAFGLMLSAMAAPAAADKTHVAVAANFNERAREIAALFQKKTSHEAILITGASGAFYTQITHGAPFEVFLSADNERPRLAVENGYAVADSSILNVLSARIVTMRPLDRYEVLAVVRLGEQANGARLLCRMTMKSWTDLALAEGQSVYYVSLNPGRGELP